MSTLDALVAVITAGVHDIQAAAAARGASYPGTDAPPSAAGDALQADLAARAAPVVAAAWQLVATLQHPQSYLLDLSFLAHLSSCLAVAEAAYVPDVLREAGEKGLHVREIAAVRNVDAGKLERILRYLASRHVFEEVSPEVFRNNRVSVALCTDKPVEEMVKSPIDRWDGTNGVAALVSLNGADNQRGAAWLAEHLLDPATGHSQEPNEAAWQRAMRTRLTTFEWMEQPAHALHLRKFGNAMRATTSADERAAATRGFAWGALPAGARVVDVGGGVGNLTMALAREHPHLRYVVQDRHAVAQEAEQLWQARMPGFVENGTVTLQGHDFFAEQPVKDADVFVVRYVTHNWADKYATQILARLRAAAQPRTKLVVIDVVADYMSRDGGAAADIPGAAKPQAPAPLLPYPDSATSWTYGMDICMMTLTNCQERTLGHFVELLKGAGWKLDRVCRFESPLPQQLICSPL
ncbi:hypothetical protein PsYK624_042550 [Phanerochaete sordida]|uniref:S-adenosyl-L-methionine-dependent methyltransferase n=1 Tax=Phanerochaete sordida TaxID=48140 RepID=A0A9P3G4X5_9APHY|nr:hypothetical protein PsYK624_042550 [Phanerochaete sordida]